MNKYLSLIFVILFFSCHKKHERGIDAIEVLYYNTALMHPMIPIACDEIVYVPEKVKPPEFLEDGTKVPSEAVVLDTIIMDKKVLQEIKNELTILKTKKDYGMDARMKCYIVYKNGQRDSLCINSSPSIGYYNGKSVQFTNKFVYLLRENCGFYKWMGIDMMPYFDELNDTTFIREKVKSINGEEY